MPESSRRESLRTSLARRLHQARSITDSLFALVSEEALLSRPIRERHRVIFYLGHLEAFDWNLLGRHTFGRDPFQASFDRLFAFGIDPVDGALPADKPGDWPVRGRIDRYVRRVRQETDLLLTEKTDGSSRWPSSTA
jgi:hypothetical protein